MKQCPMCDWRETKTLKQIAREWRVVFGDLPIWEMMRRRWIAGDAYTPIPILRDEVKRFFGAKSDVELEAILTGAALPGIQRLAVCEITDDIGRLIHPPVDVPASALATKAASEVSPPVDAITQEGNRPLRKTDAQGRHLLSIVPRGT